MKIFISYENMKRDFNGRMLLLSKFAKFKNVKEIYLGWHKDIFFELLRSVFNYKDKLILIDCNNFDFKFPFIKLLKYFNFDYYTFDEEEVGISYLKDEDIIKSRFLEKKFAAIISGKFVLGEKNYLIAQKFMTKNFEKVFNTGHPRIDFIKNVDINRKIIEENLPIKKNFVFICLPEALFRIYLFLKQEKNKKLSHFNFMKGRYYYIHNFLINIKKIVKKNNDKNFILRVHPSDKEFEIKYHTFFQDCKNIDFDTSLNTLFFIPKCEFLICGLDFVAVESNFLRKKALCYIGNAFDFDKNYDGHFSSNLPNLIYCKNFDELKESFDDLKENDKNKKIPKVSEKIASLLSFNKDSTNLIKEIIVKKSFVKEKESLLKNISRSLIKFCLIDIFKYICNLKKKNYKDFGEIDFKKFKKQFKFSPKKIFLSLFTSRIFLACLYKCLFYINFKDHSIYRMSGQQQKITQDELDLFLKFNKIDRDKYEIKLLQQGLYLRIKKIDQF